MHKNVKIVNSRMTPSQRGIYDEILAYCRAVIDGHDAAVSSIKQHKHIPRHWVRNKMVVLCGAAGTGKTFVTAKLIRRFGMKYSIAATAPTHKAVRVIGQNLDDNGIYGISTKTIQAFLKLRKSEDLVTGEERFRANGDAPGDVVDLLIVDECSMIGGDLFALIEEAVHREFCKLVLFVGDFNQLPPVGDDRSPVRDLEHSFELREVVRQARDSYIVKLASDIRDMLDRGEFVPLSRLIERHAGGGIQLFYDEKKMLEDFCFEDNWFKRDRVIATFRNMDVDRFNDAVRSRYWSLRGNQSPAQFEVGDVVVFSGQNVDQAGVLLHNNGDHAVVKKCRRLWSEPLGLWYWDCADRHNQPFMVVDAESRRDYGNKLKKLAGLAKSKTAKAEKRKLWRGYFLLKNQFVDVDFRFAMTIHKLQGSTYETVYINLNGLLSFDKKPEFLYRLLYVAVTRASKDVKVLMPAGAQKRVVQKSIDAVERGMQEIAELL